MAEECVKSENYQDKTKYPTVFGFRTGFVEVGDYDRGVMRTLNVELQDPVIGDRPRLFMRVPGIAGTEEDKVPVIFVNPEQVLSVYKVPMVLIRREGTDPAMARWYQQDEYRIPAENAVVHEKVDSNTGLCTGKGWTYLESKARAYPYDISYTIELVARYRKDANKILRKVLSVFPPYGNIVVLDDLGCARTYFAQQTGFTEITEINDLVTRQPAYAVSILVWGELDHNEPERRKTAEGVNVTLYQKELLMIEGLYSGRCYIGKPSSTP